MSAIDSVIRRLEAAKGADRIEERLGHVDIALVNLRAVRAQIEKVAAGDDAGQEDLPFGAEPAGTFVDPPRNGVAVVTVGADGLVVTPADVVPSLVIDVHAPPANPDEYADIHAANDREETRIRTMLLEHLKPDEARPLSELVEATNVDAKVARVILEELVVAGTVAKAGRGRGVAYTLVGTYSFGDRADFVFEDPPFAEATS